MFSGSLVAIVTPMTAEGAVDFTALEQLVDLHISAGTDGLVVAGTTGESATLTKSEHIAVIEAAVSFTAGRVPVIAGTGSNSTAQTVELSQTVDAMGVDGYLVVTPYYNKPPQQGLVEHFKTVADAVGKPLMLYNVPGRTGVDLLPETVARLATHPGIFGIKEATGELDRVAKLRELCGVEFMLYSGDDETSREFMLAGGNGIVSVTANVAPAAMASMCQAALAGDADKAAELDAPLAGLHRDLFIESNPIPVKWALQRMGLIGGGLRLPLVALAEGNQVVVEAALEQAGLLDK
ncbi:MAG: 4-hydroxy-tetrahydrodipicolinate synthase [Gammaproteobacteria bacterium]|nr:4-hydroxy-tetrahydrodipicolinate synthase [Gammaproteobacteria bacterium]MCP4091161.1 4-hydroxy-tetrahydrodipicolinate synthase [Gammaproteobacteria bacterium]MCP4277313.1 4-hydroxy-tetrahydrodipicolinate synthase [Gammaproteobacteria bacterium]MCP4831626.1 4-hydroxy-tetrahydrodipicolinate synthase [Gammaproteobacteria bacterium]MCP4927849.1 4-hydroxy-tetrahydrodipicolinate synthase [Gammaproteobacteria bacterium]